MRDTLQPMAGIQSIEIKVGEKNFQVSYDEKLVKKEAILDALRKAGEGAQLKS